MNKRVFVFLTCIFLLYAVGAWAEPIEVFGGLDILGTPGADGITFPDDTTQTTAVDGSLYQKRVTGTCSSGYAISGIGETGSSVTCQAVGLITGVTGISGLEGGGTSGDISISLSTPVSVANGGTGSADGSITGTGALTLTAGGTDTNINLVPNGAGTVDVASKRITGVAAPAAGTDAANKTYVDGFALPSQSGNSGKFLTTNGTTPSWDSPAGGAGSFVQTYTVTSGNTAGNGTYYLMGAGWNLNETDSHRILPISCSSATLRAALTNTSATSASYTLTVRKGVGPAFVPGTDTAVSCTVTNSVNTCSSSGAVTLAAGDSMGIKSVGNAGMNTLGGVALMVAFICN